MKLSKYFLPVLKDVSSDAKIKSHQLMLRIGMIRQSSAGIYSWLPLGYKILKKIEKVVREEQDKSGAIEMLMPTIQSSDIWRESGRYESYGEEMLRIKDRQDRELLYGPTNEELITQLFRDNIKSYKSLPLMLYHIQWKFRDEIRPRFGIMRCREFLMKDTYSFDLSEEDAQKTYFRMMLCYLKTFQKLELKAIPTKAETGPIGGDLSHEFIILADTGESEIYLNKDILNFDPSNLKYSEKSFLEVSNHYSKYYSATTEMHDKERFEKTTIKKSQMIKKGIEVGHIFYFGQKYSKPLNAIVNSKDGKNVNVYMGSYGIGVSRLVGAIIEANYNNNIMKWPKLITPFHVAIINLGKKNDSISKKAFKLYEELLNNNFEVIIDDTENNPSNKFKNFDLIGIPFQIIVGSKNKDEEFEFKELGKETKVVKIKELINILEKEYKIVK